MQIKKHEDKDADKEDYENAYHNDIYQDMILQCNVT